MSGDESRSAGVGDEVDLRPWAAYVLGHHPYCLVMTPDPIRIEQREFVPVHAPRPWESYRDILGQIESAWEILGRKNLLNGHHLAQFVKFHADIETLVEAGMSSPDGSDPPGGAAGRRKYREAWKNLASLSGKLLTATDDLPLWGAFGEAVGKSQLWLRDETKAEVLRLDELKSLVNALNAYDQYPFLGEVADQLESLGRDHSSDPDAAGTGLATGRRPALDRLAGEVQDALYRGVSPEPLLVLDRERLVFFEKEFRLGSLPAAEVALLWMLTEHVGEEVPRQQLINEGNLSRDKFDLRFSILALRKILRVAIKKYFSMRLRELPEGADDCFIVGKRGKRGEPGPYQLALPPECVRVSDDRPDWIRPRKAR